MHLSLLLAPVGELQLLIAGIMQLVSVVVCLTFGCPLAAILENGRHGRQGAVGRWLHIQICS